MAFSVGAQAIAATVANHVLCSNSASYATLQHMKTERPFYGFTPERHSEVDAQLERMQGELAALLAEYRRAAAPTNLHGYTATTIGAALTSLQNVRLALQEEQNGTGRRTRQNGTNL